MHTSMDMHGVVGKVDSATRAQECFTFSSETGKKEERPDKATPRHTPSWPSVEAVILSKASKKKANCENKGARGQGR